MIVVFGGGGFIGTYLIDRLVQDGRDVAASDISEIGEAYYETQGIPFCHVDITKHEEFDRIPAGEIEAVVHLACVQPANISAEKYTPEAFVRVNVLGTLNILDFCRKRQVPKIVYTCSHRNTQGMWHAKAGKPIAEVDGRSIMFTGDYAMFSISESAAADCVEHFAQTHDLDGIVLRLPPVYGYGPHTEIFKDGKPIKTGFQIFIEQAKQGLPLELWGDPRNGRDIIYVKDVVAAIQSAIAIPKVRGLFNISSGRLLTLQEQAECIVELFSTPEHASPITFRPEFENHIETYVYDISKAKKTLGWQPQYSFKDMLIDYQQEAESKRFDFLVKKRKWMLEGRSHI